MSPWHVITLEDFEHELGLHNNSAVDNRLRRRILKCSLCPPNRKENAKHSGKPKTKPKYKDKRK
jgi:hypothetical protein